MAHDPSDRRKRREDDDIRSEDNNEAGSDDSAESSDRNERRHQQGGGSGQGRPRFRHERDARKETSAHSARDDDADSDADDDDVPVIHPYTPGDAEYGPPTTHSQRAEPASERDADFRPAKEVWSPTFTSHAPEPLPHRAENHLPARTSDDRDDPPPRHKSSDDDFDDDAPAKRHISHASGAASSHGHASHPVHRPAAGTPASPPGYTPRPAGPIIPSSTLARAAAISAAAGVAATPASTALTPTGQSPAGLGPPQFMPPVGTDFDHPLAPNSYGPSVDHQPLLIAMGVALVGCLAVIIAREYQNYQRPHGQAESAPAAAFQQVGQMPQMMPMAQFAQQQTVAQMPPSQPYPPPQTQQPQPSNTAELLALQEQLKSANSLRDQYNKQAQELEQKNQQLALARQQDTQTYRQQNERQSQEALQKKYVTDIRLAAQAWDRGDTNQVLTLLSPYRTAEMRPLCNSFAGNYLWRAAHNGSSSTLRGHADVVRQVAFVPDGTRVATMADDATINLWDGLSGKAIGSVALERTVPPAALGAPLEDQLKRRAGGLAIAGNGAWAAAFGPNLYFGTNISQPDQVRRVNDHLAPVTALAVSPRGDMIATGDLSGLVLLHNMVDGNRLKQLVGTRPQALAFSPDGRYLYAGMGDGNLFVWDVSPTALQSTTTNSLQGTAAFGDGINSIAVSPDGTTVAVAIAMRDGVVRLWEPTTGKVRAELRGHHDEVTHVVYSRDGRSLLTASRDQTACLWSSTGGLLRTFRGHIADVETAAFSPNGQKVVSAGDDHTAILWNVDGGQPCDVLADSPIDGWVSGFAFSPDGSQLIGTGSCDNNEAYLALWNLAQNNRPTPLQTSSKAGVALAFSPDLRQMVVGESSPKEAAVRSRVRFWSLEPIRVTASFPPSSLLTPTASAATLPGYPGPPSGAVPKLNGAIQSVAYSPDGRYVVAGLGDLDEGFPASAKIFDAATGTLRAAMPETTGRSQAFFTPDGQFVVVVTTSKKRPGDVRVWSLATNQFSAQLSVPQGLDDMISGALSPNGQYLVTSHGNLANPRQADRLHVRIWDLARKQMVAEFPASHPAPVTQIVFSRKGSIVATGDVAGNVRVWDFATRRLLPKQIPPQQGEIGCMAFDLLGNRLLTGAEDKEIRVWNVDTAAELFVMELAMGKATAVRVSEDGRTIAGATSAGGLYFWDAATCHPLAILRGEGNPAGAAGHGSVITCVAGPLRDGRILTASTDKTLRIWDLNARTVGKDPLATFQQSVMCMAVAPNGRNVVVGTGRYKHEFEPGQLVLCPLDGSGQKPPILRSNVAIASVAYSPDGNLLAVCSLSSDVGQIVRRDASLIDMQTGRSLPLGSKLPQCATFSPDGRVLAIGCVDGRIELWPIGGQSATGGYAGAAAPANPMGVWQAHRAMVSVVAFAADGRTLASGGADNNAVLWDVPAIVNGGGTTGCDLLTFKHNGSVEGLKFSADGTLLATADREPTRGGVRVWRGTADDTLAGAAPPLGSPAIAAGPGYGATYGTGGFDGRAATPAAMQYPAATGLDPEANPGPGAPRGGRRNRGGGAPGT